MHPDNNHNADILIDATSMQDIDIRQSKDIHIHFHINLIASPDVEAQQQQLGLLHRLIQSLGMGPQTPYNQLAKALEAVNND